MIDISERGIRRAGRPARRYFDHNIRMKSGSALRAALVDLYLLRTSNLCTYMQYACWFLIVDDGAVVVLILVGAGADTVVIVLTLATQFSSKYVYLKNSRFS